MVTGPFVIQPGHTTPPEKAEYSYVRNIELGVACTWMHEEILTCPVCGAFTLARDHFWVIHDSGEIQEWGHADRCWTCEPFESHMPSIVAAKAMRARYVT